MQRPELVVQILDYIKTLYKAEYKGFIQVIQIDNMWHTFLLFSRDYAHFCQQYFNCFLHHEPHISNEPLFSEEEHRKNLKKFLELIIAEFGTELICDWYQNKVYS